MNRQEAEDAAFQLDVARSALREWASQPALTSDGIWLRRDVLHILDAYDALLAERDALAERLRLAVELLRQAPMAAQTDMAFQDWWSDVVELCGDAWRAAKALGYRRLITYTQEGESGSSLRAAGWRVVAQLQPRTGWSVPSRPRVSRGTDSIARTLWEAS